MSERRNMALVKEGTVINTIVFPEKGELYDSLLVDVKAQFSDCDLIDATDWVDESHPYDVVSPGFSWDGEKFIAPAPGVDTVTEESLEEAKLMMEADIARRAEEAANDPAVTPAPKTGGNE